VTAFLVQPDVRHERTSTADCNTVRVHRLSVDELAQLERAWDDLARFYPSADPPQSDEEVVAAGLDAWIAGIVSSKGNYAPDAVSFLTDLLSESDSRWPVTGLVRQAAALVSPSA